MSVHGSESYSHVPIRVSVPIVDKESHSIGNDCEGSPSRECNGRSDSVSSIPQQVISIQIAELKQNLLKTYIDCAPPH